MSTQRRMRILSRISRYVEIGGFSECPGPVPSITLFYGTLEDRFIVRTTLLSCVRAGRAGSPCSAVAQSRGAELDYTVLAINRRQFGETMARRAWESQLEERARATRSLGGQSPKTRNQRDGPLKTGDYRQTCARRAVPGNVKLRATVGLTPWELDKRFSFPLPDLEPVRPK
ncbi:hypothetical protein J6590_034643 [Homalodisca vitripennis]|nr:hypothetical protein J6590_034643 [Homalodisca vitripennis]